MSVRIRMKKMGRTHRPFFRICAMDKRAPRDGRVIEQLGTYDPMVPEADARAILNGERIQYWLSVGAQPSKKVATLIKKYGAEGTHLEAQVEAISKLSSRRAASIEAARDAASKREMPKPEEDKPAEQPAAEATSDASPESTGNAESAAEESTATETTSEESTAEATEDAGAEVAETAEAKSE